MKEGWKCPVCGRGVHPDKTECDHGGLGAVPPMHPTFVPHYPPTYTEPLPRPLWGPYEITCGGIPSSNPYAVAKN